MGFLPKQRRTVSFDQFIYFCFKEKPTVETNSLTPPPLFFTFGLNPKVTTLLCASLGYPLATASMTRNIVVVYTQGLFSATQTDEVEALVRAGLRNPVRITVREKYSKSKVHMHIHATKICTVWRYQW